MNDLSDSWGDDLSDHAPPLVKKNASRHWTDILTGQGCLRNFRKGARAPAIFAGCTPIHLAIGKKAFAGAPQVPRKPFWCLRESRKSLEKLFGVCGNPASLSKTFLVFAGAPQTFRYGAKDHSQRTPRSQPSSYQHILQ